jgi:uncharacterized surface protein with fasciclin (FAS1) repeats
MDSTFQCDTRVTVIRIVNHRTLFVHRIGFPLFTPWYKTMFHGFAFFVWVSFASLACQGFHCQVYPLFERRPSSYLKSSSSGDVGKNEGLLTVRNYLKENYGGMSNILELNDNIWKSLSGVEQGGFTIFAASNQALMALGETKQRQLLDPRNLETTQKVSAYHVISETVTADDLFNAGGVITLGGEIPIERSRTGGLFGVGGKEDGGVTINGAKVVKTIDLGIGLIHEVDTLVSPSILWRYMDQLRIPGSK